MLVLRRPFHSTARTLKRKNHYDVLKIHRHADKKAIKKQYYRLSKQYHPDLNPNDPEAHKKFLEVNEAYAVLGNEASRRQYDSEMDLQPPSSSWSSSSAVHRTGPSAFWRARAARQATGSASAKAQAEGMRSQKTAYNFSEKYARRYEAEEERRRARMSQAAERRRAAGLEEEPEHPLHRRTDSFWSRLWRLGLLLAGIAYATQKWRELERNDRSRQT